MKIATGILMVLACLVSGAMFVFAESVPQQAAAVAPAVITYIFGRGLENFVPSKSTPKA